MNPGASPTFDSGRTSGFTAVSHAATGLYCLTPATGISQLDRPAAVTVDWVSTSDPEGNATALSSPGSCSGSQFGVRTERSADVSNAAPADNVGFTIIVP